MRQRWQNFGGGLWITGPREDNPQGTLRRAKGVAPLRSVALRSRSGTLGYFTLDAHSMTRFDDEYLIGAGVDLYVSVNRAIGSESVVGSAPAGGPGAQDGTRLTFVQMPPTAGVADQVFIAGGGVLVKKEDSSIGDAPTFWGITPPDYTNGAGADAALSLATQQVTAIDNFEAGTAGVTYTDTGDDPLLTLTDDTTRFTQGAASLRLTLAKDSSSDVTRDTSGAPLDLSIFAGPVTSFNEDFISFDIRINRPKHIKSIGIMFDVDTGVGNLFKGRTLSRDLKVRVVNRAKRKRLIGTGDLIKGTRVKSGQREKDFVTEMVDQLRDRSQAEFIAEDTVAVSRRKWTRVTIPKAAFEPGGDATNDNTSWSAVRAIRLSVETNKLGRANVNFDKLRMLGGTGMLGDYQYHYTFLNSDTGTRSNPDLTTGPLTIKDVERQGVTHTNVPFSTDPQVDFVEVWRTLGNGSVFFKATERSNVDAGGGVIAAFTDTTADYIGLAEGATTILDPTKVLPFDNIKPANTYEDAAGPHLARMWWGRDTAAGAGGRVYFSPVGRAEAVESFIEVGTDEDQVQKLVIFDQRLYVFTQKHVYHVTGNDISSFQAVEIFGVPGTLQPFTVVPTPGGIIYRAFDGVRAFDGSTSRFANNDAIAPILRNSTTDGLTDFVGDYAAYGRGEYYISDSRDSTRTTLAIDASSGAWRNIGFPSNFLFFDSEANILFGRNVPATVVDAMVIHSNTHTGSFTVAANLKPGGPADTETTHADAALLAPRDFSIFRFAALPAAALTGVQTATLQFNVNGSLDPGISLSFTSADSANVVKMATGTVDIVAGDLVSIQVTLGGGAAGLQLFSLSYAYTIVPE